MSEYLSFVLAVVIAKPEVVASVIDCILKLTVLRGRSAQTVVISAAPGLKARLKKLSRAGPMGIKRARSTKTRSNAVRKA